MARRCLIVANQTLGGEALDEAVRERIGRGMLQFYVLVPRTRVEDESAGWADGFILVDETWGSPQTQAAMEEHARRSEAKLQQAETRARERLQRMMEKIKDMGAEADGEIGSDDPFETTKAALERRHDFDEIIVSTLPAGISRWLKMDLANRIARISDVPVTSVEARDGQ